MSLAKKLIAATRGLFKNHGKSLFVVTAAALSCADVLASAIFGVRHQTLLALILKLVNIDGFFYLMLAALISYLVLGFALFFYWGSLGLRGIFYTAELQILTAASLVLVALYINLKYHISLTACAGEIFITDDNTIYCVVHLDLLSLTGVLVVLALTAIALTFGIEYMSREAFAYNVIVILTAFSASIV